MVGRREGGRKGRIVKGERRGGRKVRLRGGRDGHWTVVSNSVFV